MGSTGARDFIGLPNAFSDERVRAHFDPFLIGERAAFKKNGVRHAHLANVVEKTAAA